MVISVEVRAARFGAPVRFRPENAQGSTRLDQRTALFGFRLEQKTSGRLSIPFGNSLMVVASVKSTARPQFLCPRSLAPERIHLNSPMAVI